MALVVDILKSFVIARPRVEINRVMRPLLDIVANIADRQHPGPIGTNRTIQKGDPPEIVRTAMAETTMLTINYL